MREVNFYKIFVYIKVLTIEDYKRKKFIEMMSRIEIIIISLPVGFLIKQLII